MMRVAAMVLLWAVSALLPAQAADRSEITEWRCCAREASASYAVPLIVLTRRLTQVRAEELRP